MSLIIQITKGLIRDTAVRRKIMGGCVLIALTMLLSGGSFLWRSLTEEPWAFVVFWTVCLWMTVLSLLLAIFDMLVLRAAARRERSKLKEKTFREEKAGDGK